MSCARIACQVVTVRGFNRTQAAAWLSLAQHRQPLDDAYGQTVR